MESLDLKWDSPSGRSANLGSIQRDGAIWTSVLSARRFMGREYNEALAAAWGGSAEGMPWGTKTKWQLRIDGQVPQTSCRHLM